MITLMIAMFASQAVPFMAAPAGADTTAAVTIELDRDACNLGDSVVVSVANATEEVIVFAPVCDLFVDGLADDAWVSVYRPDCSNIRPRPVRVAPGKTVPVDMVVDPCPAPSLANFEAFRVRLRFQIEVEGGYRFAVSRSFAVRAPE